MNRRLTKKSVIQSYLERARPRSIGLAEIASIRQEIRQALGERTRISDEYLFAVLDKLGVRVEREVRGIAPEIFGVLHFGTLEAAEQTLRFLDQRYRAALERKASQEAGDCRAAALHARRRSEMIARNKKVAPEKRAVKGEIARWFTIWLQTPDAFWDWLELRKKTAEFRSLFAGGGSSPPAH